MSLNKKRKVDSECRIFNGQWNLKYFFIEKDRNAQCVICNELVAVLKEYNISRHYETKHAEKFDGLTGKVREDKFNKLNLSLYKQQSIFKNVVHENEAVTKLSYRISYEIIKVGKAFTDGELFKKCMIMTSEELCPEKLSQFNAVSVSARTIARRAEEISFNLCSQLREKISKFETFSIAVDESTDVSDMAQILLFIRGVNFDFDVTEELVNLISLQGTTTGEDIFNGVKASLNKYNHDLFKLKCVTTDGGRNMCGTKNGFFGKLYAECEATRAPKPMALHCIIHQQALCGRSTDMSSVLEPVTRVVNFIRSHGLNHRQFTTFLDERESLAPDLPYHSNVRWLSSGNVLSRSFFITQ